MIPNWLDPYFKRTIQQDGVNIPSATALNFVGFTVTPNPGNQSNDVTIGAPDGTVAIGPTGARCTTKFYAGTTTTNTANIVIGTWPLADLMTSDFDVEVTGTIDASADAARFNLSMSWTRRGGSPAAMGTVTSADPRSTSGASAAAATLLVSGNNATVCVTGITATPMTWKATAQIRESAN